MTHARAKILGERPQRFDNGVEVLPHLDALQRLADDAPATST